MSEVKDHLNSSLFQPGKNCWRTGKIRHGAMVIDSANYYRALHEAIIKARYSIFILGWEIDSQVHLLRGEEAEKSPYPSIVVELLAQKASENPDLKVYLLRWDSSVAFVIERELFTEHAWAVKTPENLHIHLDSEVPMAGSHHQKVVVIDDEIVFTGGMDIARQRWDERKHAIDEPGRQDVLGSYGPYHDVQILVSGPIVEHFSELCRWRWKRATGYDAIPARPIAHRNELPPCWPTRCEVSVENIDGAISRTIPWLGDGVEAQEILQMYLDLIAKAENFIYMENQFFTYLPIAKALHRRLKARPTLQVLLVSSFNPQGIFESEGLWSSRIVFKKLLQKNVKDRAKLACVGIRPEQEECHKRIHSKVTVIDDRFLMVASSNINNRSMAVDTECDLILEATNDQHKKWIEFVRNDLIAEHLSTFAVEVEGFFKSQNPLQKIMNYKVPEGYSLFEINDKRFVHRAYLKWAKFFADPKEPLMRNPFSHGPKPVPLRNPRKIRILFGIFLFFLGIAALLFIRENAGWLKPKNIALFLEQSRASTLALPIVCMVYIIGGFVLFPVTLLSLITAGVFGALWGPIYGMIGALLSASLMFAIGRWAGNRGLRKLFGSRLLHIDQKFKNTGVIGVTAVRLLPIAPFSIVNLAAGMSSLSFFDFLLGSFFGFLPAFLAKGFLGDSLVQVFIKPSYESAMYFVFGFSIWLAVVTGTYFVMRRWQKARAESR